MKTGNKYLCWIYDSPFVRVYKKNAGNPCNYIFVFDKVIYQDLVNKGIDTVYYMPLGVNVNRLAMIRETDMEKKKYAADVSFVGSLYDEKHNLYQRLKEKLNPYTCGYLEGIMNAQKEIYGYNILEQSIPEDILNTMYEALPYEIEPDSYATRSYIYANYFLCRKITEMERKEMLTLVSEKYTTKLYTFNQDATVGKCKNMGPVDYIFEMPKVFRSSKINLNITLKSIQSGIPLRAMDILGAGGFLLTNFQEDFLEFFEPEQDFVYYSSKEELMDKVDYYLRHDEERFKIATSGYEKVCKEHDDRLKLLQMFQIAGL